MLTRPTRPLWRTRESTATAGSVKTKEAHDYRLQPKAVGATFHYFARRVLKKGMEPLQ